MKRSEFIRELRAADCILERHGARHDVYRNPATGHRQLVPRHTGSMTTLAKHIKKYLGLKS